MSASSSQQVYEKTWRGQYWGRDGVIAQAKRNITHPPTAGEISALSSTYYSAAGHAFAKLQTSSIFRKPFWAFRSLWCLFFAGYISNLLVQRFGLSGMTPDQLDVRARILFRQKRYGRALEATMKGLSQKDLPPDTEALLKIGLAEIQLATGYVSLAAASYGEALGLISRIRPTTTVRLYRSLADFYRKRGYHEHKKDMAAKALEVAQKHKLDDQVVKLAPLLK